MDGGVRLTRRDVLRLGAVTGPGLAVGGCPADRRHAARESTEAPEGPADVTIRIAPVLVELVPHLVISTIGYNGSVPAPIIRLREGHPVIVELINETDTPELVHWHGQMEGSEDIWPRGMLEPPPRDPRPNGFEVGYRFFSINGKALGHGEPVRVGRGERVMFRILNASATENIQLALPGHEFEVVALDGNAVPPLAASASCPLDVAERIDAIVTMDNPGIWILGTPRDDDRRNGMGIVVEDAGASDEPRWIPPAPVPWGYAIFGVSRPVPEPDERIPLVFGKINGGPHGFNRWTINGEQFEDSSPIPLRAGRRYRLAFVNRTADVHPVHLHRHSFELVSVNGRPTAGIVKDTVVVPPFGTVEADFVADNPGATLFHCHQIIHMEYGFKRLFTYVE